MYGFGEELTKENILSRITSYDIFKFYSDNFIEIGKSFVSDTRSDDEDPSACIAVVKNDLLYTDFGTQESFRCIDYVMKRLNIDYFSALQQINLDFDLKLGIYGDKGITKKSSKVATRNKNVKLVEKTPTILRKKQRPFTAKDLEYWNSFYWTEWMLNEAKTQSISHYWINEYMFEVKPNELAFTYEYYHHPHMQRKLYFPLRKKFKWFSNVDTSIVQLVDVMPKKGDVLFITSSKKDAGVFWRMQLEKMFDGKVIHGVAANNEGSFVPDEWFHKMQTRWNRIIIWHNNDWTKKDNPGVTNAKKHSEKYGIEYYYNPDGEPKDPSDFCKKYNLVKFKELVESKL